MLEWLYKKIYYWRNSGALRSSDLRKRRENLYEDPVFHRKLEEDILLGRLVSDVDNVKSVEEEKDEIISNLKEEA